MKVLVATPHRVNQSKEFIEGTKRHFAGLTYWDKEIALFPNEIQSQNKYGANATARNMLIDNCLKDEHDYVLWMDVDLVKVPADLIEQLLKVSEEAIVAPFVYVEKRNEYAQADWDNGGWFYDTGGFCRGIEFAHPFWPHFQGYAGGLIELSSVGCCYIVPAWLYRKGLRYSVTGNEVEHLSFCDSARQAGVRVFATDETHVLHAFLPRHGEQWHG